jgi:hypothetical protein
MVEAIYTEFMVGKHLGKHRVLTNKLEEGIKIRNKQCWWKQLT